MFKPFIKHSSLILYAISQDLHISPIYYYNTIDEYGWCVCCVKWSDKNK